MVDGNHIVVDFISNTKYQALPSEVQYQAKRCFLDILGATLAGTTTPVGHLIARYAVDQHNGSEATILMTNHKASIVGATLANAFAANALDVDDGYRLIKGHPGANIFPAALAIAEKEGKSGEELLEAFIIGYEVAIRAGLILHGIYSSYHGSGSWGALGAAAAATKLLSLGRDEIHYALGIAEYHAPITPMMRSIDCPGMVKDGIGWGSMVGVSAALLAQKGFTGIDSLLGNPEHENLINELGRRFEILNLYFKPYPCCRWTQPAVDGVLAIVYQRHIKPHEIKRVTVHTFRAATRMTVVKPRNTEEAQYSLAYPVAAAIIDGEFGLKQVLGDRLEDEAILELADKVKIVFSDKLEDEFPERCLCEVEIITDGNQSFRSGIMTAKGDPDIPLSDKELERKFRQLASSALDARKVQNLIETVWHLEELKDVRHFTKELG
jgi:2-methylcitrate dehydratase PrpD